MAKYEHLPIYKAAFDLNLYFEKVVRNFSRYHKYTLGTELRNCAREVVRLIVRANNALAEEQQEKRETLQSLREELEQLKLTIRLCKELKAFNNFKSFQVAINQVITISKQNEGWLKSLSQTDSRSQPQSDRA
ncbi:MAG: four helix bundle protein [Gammaproteobacteria bacterium]|nr:four helix bundle protein [Gammaproteobacteria bacterium]